MCAVKSIKDRIRTGAFWTVQQRLVVMIKVLFGIKEERLMCVKNRILQNLKLITSGSIHEMDPERYSDDSEATTEPDVAPVPFVSTHSLMVLPEPGIYRVNYRQFRRGPNAFFSSPVTYYVSVRRVRTQVSGSQENALGRRPNNPARELLRLTAIFLMCAIWFFIINWILESFLTL